MGGMTKGKKLKELDLLIKQEIKRPIPSIPHLSSLLTHSRSWPSSAPYEASFLLFALTQSQRQTGEVVNALLNGFAHAGGKHQGLCP